jgi:uncharacterized membrane protein YqaE (UPF0057 family)
MSLFRVILSIIFPPLAVLDKGCGSLLIVTLLTCCGWIPGVIGALVILNKEPNYPTYPTYPTHYSSNNSPTRCQY